MNLRGPRLPRRTLLTGLGGVTLSLPMLECMLNPNGNALVAQTSALPRRYGIVFAGQAIGGDGYPKNRTRLGDDILDTEGHFITPAAFGADYDLTLPLEPLAELRTEVSLISHLSIPFNSNSDDPSSVPAGGAYRDFHGGGCSPLLSGTRSTAPDFRCYGVTSDQVIADLNRGQTLVDSLVYRVQPSWYLAGSSYAGRQYLSYDANAERIEAQVSPQIAYQALFDNFTPDDAAAREAHDFRKRSRLSVLDLVGEKRARVLAGLSSADQTRLERHYDELRDLELRIDGAALTDMGSCRALQAPGDDPPIGGDNAGSASDSIGENTGYSNEALRAELLVDLLHMALTCDLTRAFTLQLTVFQSHMNVFSLTNDMGLPLRADLHEVGHNGDAQNRGQLPVSTCLQWHIQFYARLLSKLAATPEGDGTLLDNSAIFFMPEAGHGRQLNDAVSEDQTHSVENMILLLAGRAGGLQPGRHLDGSGTHPAQTLLSGMRAAGFDGDSLGEVSGYFRDVFG